MTLEWIGASSIGNPKDPDFPRDVWIKACDITKVFANRISLPLTPEGFVTSEVLMNPKYQVSYVKVSRLRDQDYVVSGPYPHEEAREIAAKLVELLGGSSWIGVK